MRRRKRHGARGRYRGLATPRNFRKNRRKAVKRKLRRIVQRIVRKAVRRGR